MGKIKDWQKFAQKLAEDFGGTVTVVYETEQVEVARAEPRKRRPATDAKEG